VRPTRHLLRRDCIEKAPQTATQIVSSYQVCRMIFLTRARKNLSKILTWGKAKHSAYSAERLIHDPGDTPLIPIDLRKSESLNAKTRESLSTEQKG
jgi:hypothetical protein